MPGLDDLYHEPSCYTLAHPDPSFIHQHIVDAYKLNMPMRLQSQSLWSSR